jgi:type VI protein secretion system component VasF
MSTNEAFRQLVVEDAQSVKQRQETDSIDIIDEIRYILVRLIDLAIENVKG